MARKQRQNHQVILIGHKGHPEVVGTMGQLRDGAIHLVEDIEDVKKLSFENIDNVAYITQTTLSLDDTSEIISALKIKFPSIKDPKKEDICYATTNRQNAVKALAEKVGIVLIIGAPNSSNSLRLVEVARKAGCKSMLIQRASDIYWKWFDGVEAVGISAGASAPEVLVEEVLGSFKNRYETKIENIMTIEENVIFKVPAILSRDDR